MVMQDQFQELQFLKVGFYAEVVPVLHACEDHLGSL